jgi:hypothetical protein
LSCHTKEAQISFLGPLSRFVALPYSQILSINRILITFSEIPQKFPEFLTSSIRIKKRPIFSHNFQNEPRFLKKFFAQISLDSEKIGKKRLKVIYKIYI